jgi:hypothetical protein
MRAASRIITAVFLCLIIPVSAQAEGVLSLESTTGPTGGEATVKVSQKEAKATGALDMEISFPPEAFFISVAFASDFDP